MDPQRRRQIETLFDEALERPSLERDAWLSRECAADPGLLAEVEALLAAHGLAERIFEPRPPAGADAPERIGPYRLVRELGRGGMGRVYLAERDDGQYRSRVALKLIRGGADDGQLRERLVAERQILAALGHPNIARLLDGGVADDGRPYLVMEYVDGLPITTHADRHRLGIEERLRLFADVCSAVQHAHQNLVIHRDLKPGNILVTPAGQVKLLDFGIAKLLNPTLGAASAPVTRTEFRVMTPEYASPEQVRGDAITTSSDLYSLGVLLYELLAGHPPYRLAGRSSVEALDLVCHRDPERPSTRVGREERVARPDGTTEEVTPRTVAEARGLPPERLRRRLRGDLDGIVMMALRKEPARRYRSADLLRRDVEQYLAGRPVEAHRGSRRYRAGKFVRRHRVEVAAAALVLAGVLGGAGVAGWQARIAGDERDRAELSRLHAELALGQSEEVTRFLLGMFEAANLDPAAGGEEVTARDLLSRGAARADDLTEQPEVQARMLDVIGRMYHQLGEYDEARRSLRRAVQIRRRALGPGSLELAATLVHLSWVHRSLSEPEDARKLLAEALEIRRRVLQPDDPGIAELLHELGRVAGSSTEGEALYREALDMLQKTGADPDRQVALLMGLATFARRHGRFPDAVSSDREAVRRAQELLGPDHVRTGAAMIHLADQVRDIERDLAAAEHLYRRGLTVLSRHYGEQHLELLHGIGALAWLLAQRGNHEEAEQLYRRALAIRTAAAGPDHPQVGAYMNALAGGLELQGRLDEAEALSRQALELWVRVLGPGNRSVAAGLPRLASILARQGRFEEADQLYREALSIRIALGQGQTVVMAEARRLYGRALIARRRFPDAEEQLLESLAILERAFSDPDHPNTRDTRRALMELYAAWGKPDLVERHRVPPGVFVPY